MTSPASVLQQVRSLGVDIRPDGDKLQLRPPGRTPAELIEAIRQHKAEILTILAKPRQPMLERAIDQKRAEINVMRKRLASDYYAGDVQYQEWGKDVLACLQAHTSEIQRYQRDGGSLRLPPCCKDDGHICLIAMRRFDGCLMHPSECTFSIPKC